MSAFYKKETGRADFGIVEVDKFNFTPIESCKKKFSVFVLD
jgi:hypothetical protein